MGHPLFTCNVIFFYFCIILDTDKEKCNMLVYLYSFLRHGWMAQNKLKCYDDQYHITSMYSTKYPIIHDY